MLRRWAQGFRLESVEILAVRNGVTLQTRLTIASLYTRPRKAPVSLVMPVARLLDWFRSKFSVWEFLLRSVEMVQIWLKSDKKYLARWISTKFFFIVAIGIVAQQYCGNALLCFRHKTRLNSYAIHKLPVLSNLFKKNDEFWFDNLEFYSSPLCYRNIMWGVVVQAACKTALRQEQHSTTYNIVPKIYCIFYPMLQQSQQTTRWKPIDAI